MNIGEFKQSNGRLMGWIATRTIDLPRLGLRPVASDNDRAPAYEIVALNVGNRWVQVGALWKAVSNSSGEFFLQGSIEDPSLAEPLPVALFGTSEEGMRVAWRRPQRRDDFGPVIRMGRTGADGDGAGHDGFGDSTAGPGGVLMEQAPLVEDQIPF